MRRTRNLLGGLPAQAFIGLTAIAAVSGAYAQARNPVPVETTHGTTAESALGTAGAPQTGAGVEFLREALNTAMAEEQMGALAQQKGGSAAVREYGKKLQADHASSVRDIKGLLATLNVVVASEPTGEAQAHMAALAKLSGPQFDAAFVPLMIASHEESVEKYGAQTHANSDKQLSLFASKALPMLREHLAAAQSLSGSAPRPAAH